jgi:tetratricopeptide (TPR) repeat protein
MINELALYEEFWSRKNMISSTGEYRDNMEKLAKNEINSIDNLNESIETQTRALETQTGALIASQAALAHTMNQGLGQINNTLQAGFTGISNQLGYMTATMNTGFLNLENTINRMNAQVCEKLDSLYNAAIRPLLVKTREYYNLAAESYKGGLFDEALDYINKALVEYKTDYISWFLQGKIYAFGASKYSNVIDLDKAINAFQNAVKYNEQYIGKSDEARRMAAEIHYNLGTAQFTKSNDLKKKKKKTESDEMLEKAKASFDQSYKYSDNMLESLFNNARCKVLQGEYTGALSDLETLVLKDRNYCLKVYANPEFSNIKEKIDNLIKKLKQDAFNRAKMDCDRLNYLITELKSLGGYTNVTVPLTFTEALPYFDILDSSVHFDRDLSVLKKSIAERKAYLEQEAEDKARREREAAEREEERKSREERDKQWQREWDERKAKEKREKIRKLTGKFFAVFCAVLAFAIPIVELIMEGALSFGGIFICALISIPFLVIFFSDMGVGKKIFLAINILINAAFIVAIVALAVSDGKNIGYALAVLGYGIISVLSCVLAIKFPRNSY